MSDLLDFNSSSEVVQIPQAKTKLVGNICDMTDEETNWAFIDMQNLYMGVKERGWRIKWKLFREYLQKEHKVTKAVAFMGFVKENIGLYCCLKRAGFVLEFREVKRLGNRIITGGNVDADLSSYVMDYKNDYSRAILVADDGDYCRTIKSLNRQKKLKLLLALIK